MRKNERIRIHLAILALLLCIIAILMPQIQEPVEEKPVGTFFNTGIDANAQHGEYQGQSEEEIQEMLNQKIEEGMITIHMYPEVVFENGRASAVANMYVEPQNREPQVIQIIREDTQDIIYQSGLIPIASRVEKIQLNTNLPKGNYPCRARFHRVDAETGEVLGIAEYRISVIVKN